MSGPRRTRLCGRHEATVDLQRARTLVEAARVLLGGDTVPVAPRVDGDGSPLPTDRGVHSSDRVPSLPTDVAAAVRTLAVHAGVAAARAACCAALGQRAAKPAAAVPLLAAVRPSGVQMSEDLATLLHAAGDGQPGSSGRPATVTARLRRSEALTPATDRVVPPAAALLATAERLLRRASEVVRR